MKSTVTTERRRSPRVAVDGAAECCLDLSMRVRVLDISVNGALLAAEVPLPVGEAARLRSTLGPNAFYTDIEVKRTAALPADVGLCGLGAAFLTMDERSRRSLEEFLRRASQ